MLTENTTDRSSTLKECSVLVIDENEDLRDLIADLLGEHSATVHGAESADEARALCRKIKFDLVILDLGRSPKTGIASLESLREFGGPYPILAVMNSGIKMNLEDLYNLGVSAFIKKPLDFDDVPRIADNLIHKRTLTERPGGKRLPTHIPVRFRFADRPWRGEGRVFNLSQTGMLIKSTGMNPDVGWNLEFKIGLENSKIISGQAKVRWLQITNALESTSEFGIEFEKLTPGSLPEIQKLLKKLEINLGKTA